MFGINSWEQVGQIMEGHYKEITHQENELYETRIKICRKCPLYSKTALGEVCDAKKCYNVKTNTLELLPGKNTTCGCGCRLAPATRVKNKECVLGKW